MAQKSYTANSSTTIGYARYNSTTWNTGSSYGAMQGLYTTSSSSLKSYNRIGVMVFNNVGTDMSGKNITNIQLQFVCAGSGYDSASKVLSLYSARRAGLVTGITGEQQIGTALGTLTGRFYNTTLTFQLNSSTNSSLYTNLRNFILGGGYTLACYSGETSKGGSHNYSYNYLKITSATMTVTYDDAAPIKYYDGSAWKDCYAYYYDGSAWKLCDPYYYDGSAWKRV